MSNEEPTEQHEDYVVDFIKSNLFRMVYAEGFLGGTTGEGNITLSFYNSRDAIPKRMRFQLDEEGNIQMVGRELRADQVREVEVGIIMNVESARALQSFLSDLIADVEGTEESKEENTDG